MRVSVIIPALNEERTLPLLLESLHNQTRPPEEIIVAVSPKSSDGTREVAKRAGVTVVEGGMPAEARNAGAERATGNLLVFMDADVQCGSEDFLERAEKEMRERGLEVAVCDQHTAGPLKGRAFLGISNLVVRAGSLLRSPFAIGTCMFATRDAFEDIGGFDATITLFEDSEFVQRAHKKGKRLRVLSRRTHIVPDTRRLSKRGLWGTLLFSVRVQMHRLRHGELRDMELDPEYFEHEN